MTQSGLYVVIAGGDEPRGLALQYVREAEHIICADSGADFCYRSGFMPDMIIGDLDSLSPEAADYFTSCGVRFSVFPSAKDHTDADLALAACAAKNPQSIVLTGALGKRIDHSLANVILLVKYPQLVIASEFSELRLCRGRLKLRGRVGDIMTLIPLSPVVKNVHLRGFRYELHGEDLLMRNNIGVSNVFVTEEAEICAELGELLVVYTQKEEIAKDDRSGNATTE